MARAWQSPLEAARERADLATVVLVDYGWPIASAAAATGVSYSHGRRLVRRYGAQTPQEKLRLVRTQAPESRAAFYEYRRRLFLSGELCADCRERIGNDDD